MAQYAIDLPCIADTYIDAENPTTNYGTSQFLNGGGSNPVSSYRYHALLKFNWVTLPERKKIINVKARLYSLRLVPSAFQSGIYIGVGSKDFNESTTNFNNYGSSGRGMLDFYRDQDILANQWYEFDITGLYNNYITNLMSFGIKTLWTKTYRADSPDFWQIESREGSNKPILRITYEDVPPNKPTLREPIGVYKDSASVVRFEWKYNSSVGGEQKEFDLQWSTNQLDWTTISETTENTFYDMPADTLPAGNVYWRVRTYNEYDESSGYSDIQSFYAIGAPTTPNLNAVPTDTSRPVVTWSAFSQQVYQLQVLSGDNVAYDSGIVPGINIRSHKITAWLADGEYTVQMRIKNEYDMWSEWGSAAVAISTVKPTKPTLTLQQSTYGIEINATGLIYRTDYDKDNFICIGTAAGNFYDNTVKSNAEYKYFVRAVSENDTFADSDVKFIQADFRHSLIAPVSSLNNVFVFMHGLNTPPNRTYNRQPGGASVMYAGRKHPVWEPTEHISTGLSLQFYLEIWAEVEAFTAIYDQNSTVLYRDAKGRKIYGTLSNLSVADDILGYIISFTLNQVDYIEKLEV